jgi:hypothetical protein
MYFFVSLCLCGTTVSFFQPRGDSSPVKFEGEIAINQVNFSFFEVMRKGLLFFFITLLALSSCVKPPSYSVIPHITFKSVSSTLLHSGYVDTITFSFTDGDGDIYVNTSDSSTCGINAICGLKHGDSSCLHLTDFNIFLIDSHDSCVSFFASPNLQPSGNYKAISGDIEVITAVDNLSCINCAGGCPIDSVIYTIILRDQAQHFSNIIRTPAIYTTCP